MTLYIAQCVSIPFSVDENTQKVKDLFQQVCEKTDLMVFPACFLAGAAPGHAHRMSSFQQNITHNLQQLAALTQSGKTSILLGVAPNCAVYIHSGTFSALPSDEPFIYNGIPIYLTAQPFPESTLPVSRPSSIVVNLLGTDGIYIWPGGITYNDTPLIPYFEEGGLFWPQKPEALTHHVQTRDCAQLYKALTFALRMFMRQNNLRSVILGLSGGMDSSLVATLAADALGPTSVTGVMMRTRYTSGLSIRLAQELARNLGIAYFDVDLEKGLESINTIFKPLCTQPIEKIVEENMQARLRGLILMALSNQNEGAIVLATGNKSEICVGYATLYGDMCGAYTPLKDVYKTKVYALAHWRNKPHNSRPSPFPADVLTRRPTAELSFNQFDQDILPEYNQLDALLEDYLEHNKPWGGPPALYTRIKRAAHKRQQAASGPRVTPACWGVDIIDPIF